MRKLSIITATAVSAAGLALGAIPAGAATHLGGNEEFCEALPDVDDFGDPGADPSSVFDPDAADDYADALRDAARHAPKKVKKAIRRVAKVYDNIDDQGVAAASIASERFIRDSLTYSTYYLETCADITIPTPQP